MVRLQRAVQYGLITGGQPSSVCPPALVTRRWRSCPRPCRPLQEPTTSRATRQGGFSTKSSARGWECFRVPQERLTCAGKQLTNAVAWSFRLTSNLEVRGSAYPGHANSPQRLVVIDFRTEGRFNLWTLPSGPLAKYTCFLLSFGLQNGRVGCQYLRPEGADP